MKRMSAMLISMFIAMVLICSCAVAADGALSRSFPAAMTAGSEQTAGEWLTDETERALLTVSLWLDYGEQDDAAPCDVTGLLNSLVAQPKDGGYLMVVISAGDGRLTMYFLPETGEASYLW